MDNRVDRIRRALQYYWATNATLQKLFQLDLVLDNGDGNPAPTLRTIMEDLERESLPAGLSEKEVLCITTLFRWWYFRVGQGSNHKLASERINQVRSAYSVIPPHVFTQINTELNKHARETKWVIGLPVIEMSDYDENNEELRGIGGRQRKRNLANDQDADGIPGRKKPLKEHLKIATDDEMFN